VHDDGHAQGHHTQIELCSSFILEQLVRIILVAEVVAVAVVLVDVVVVTAMVCIPAERGTRCRSCAETSSEY